MIKTIRHLDFKDAKRLMRNWVKENYDGTQSPYAAEAFLEYLYEHNFEIVIEANIWNVILPKRSIK